MFFTIHNISCETLRETVASFFWDFSQSSFSGGKFIAIFIYRKFNFCNSYRIFSYSFSNQCDCCSILKALIIFFIDIIYCCFFFCFLCNQENHMIRHNWNLLHDFSNTINEHNQRQTDYLSSILNYCIYF